MKRIAFGLPAALGSETSFVQDESSLQGFEELAMPLFDSLYNFARWMARDSDDAEDIVQETYLKALRGFPSFQPNTNFRAWMFRILKNTFLSSRSKLERRMTVALESEDGGPELAVESETPDTILMKRWDSESVQYAIESLPANSREVLLLCEVEEMSYQEIAKVLSIPIGTVMSRLARARKAIRESLGRSSSTTVSAGAAQEGARRKASIQSNYASMRESDWEEPELGL